MIRRKKILFWVLLQSLVVVNAAASQTLPVLEPVMEAPEFVLPDDGGKIHRLSDYRGKVVVLNFWATWCPPCRQEMPSMERAWEQLKNEAVVVLAVDVGESAATVFEFTGQYPVTFPLLLDSSGEVVNKFPVIGLPTTFIISPKGLVTHRAVGGRAWDDPELLQMLRAMRR